MSNGTRNQSLEASYERLLTLIGDIQASIRRLQQPSASGGGQGNGGGGGTIYSMVGVVIAAGGSVTGATVNALVGGVTTAVSTNATVYNQMQSATVVTKTIMLGQNPDGTFSAISQSC
jgi:hypothetical protein